MLGRVQRALLLPSMAFFVAVVVHLTSGRSAYESDSQYLWETAMHWVDEGNPRCDRGVHPFTWRHADGSRYMPYPLGMTFVMVPSYVALRAICPLRAADPSHSFWENQLAKAPMSVFAGLLAAAMFVLLSQLYVPRRLAFWLAMATVFATNCWFYYRLTYSEGMQTLALVGLIASAIAFRRRPRGSMGAMVGFWWFWLVQVKLTYLVVGPITVVYTMWPLDAAPETRSPAALAKRLLAALPAVSFAVATLAISIAWNLFRYERAFVSSYALAGQTFSNNPFVGFYGIFLAPGKSFFLYAPLTLLAVFGMRRFFRQHRAEALFVSAIFLALVPPLVTWWAWSGDWAWGPRFFVPFMPLWVVPAALALSPGTGFGAWGRSLLSSVVAPALVASGFVIASLGNWMPCWRYIGPANSAVTLAPAHKDDLVHLHFLPEWQPIVAHAWIFWNYMHHRMPAPDEAPWAGRYQGATHYDYNLSIADLEPDYWVWVEWQKQPGKARGGLAIFGALALLSACSTGFALGGPPRARRRGKKRDHRLRPQKALISVQANASPVPSAGDLVPRRGI